MKPVQGGSPWRVQGRALALLAGWVNEPGRWYYSAEESRHSSLKVARCATTDMAPGTHTSAARVAADAPGLPVERVRFEPGDSTFPAAKEHGGSTTMASVGSAVQAACAAPRSRLAGLGGGTNDPGSLLRGAGLQRLDAQASATPGDGAKTHSSAGFGAVFAEVRVEPDFCTIRVARLIGACDAGRVVSPGSLTANASAAWPAASAWHCRRRRSGAQASAASPTQTLAECLVPVCADIGGLDAILVGSEGRIMTPLGVEGLAGPVVSRFERPGLCPGPARGEPPLDPALS